MLRGPKQWTFDSRRLGSGLGLALLLMVAGCSQNTGSGKTYVVRHEAQRIVFRGVDQPSIVDDRPGDHYEDSEKLGHFNVSRNDRCAREASKAVMELHRLVAELDTAVLLNSFRVDAEGQIDYYVARDGNWLIAHELSRRRPLPAHLVEQFDTQGRNVFLGASGPPCPDLTSLLDMAEDNSRKLGSPS